MIAALHVAAQSATPPRRFEYTRSMWRVSDGLPEDTVQALEESNDGRLWIGTTGGLARFDGSHMDVSGLGLPNTLSASSIFCLSFGRNGVLWAGTEGGGLLRIAGSAIQIFSARDGLTDGFVRTVFEDDRGRLWIGTDDGLFVMQSGRLRRVDGGSGPAPMAVHSITQDSEKRIWVGGSRLLTINPDSSVTEYPLPGEYSQNRVKRIFQAKDGTVWVGTVGGLQRLEDGRFRSVPGIHATVRSILQTDDGKIWIGTIGAGLWTLAGGTLAQVGSSGLLPSDTVLSIVADDRRQIWVGTQAGLVRLAQTPINVVALPEGGDPDFETISGDARGDLWVAAQRLYLIHSGVAQRVEFPELKGITVRNVYRARDGALWIGTDGSGVFRMEGRTQHYTAERELTNNFIRAFLESRDGSMWIATDEGVSRIGPAGGLKLTEANGLAYFSTRSLLEDASGDLWIGTDRGLSRWSPKTGRFVHDATTERLAKEKVWCILQDRRGVLWFGTRDHGLFRLQGGGLRQFSNAQGLPSNSIYQILQDRSGTFWLTGPNTIASVREDEMEEARPDADGLLSVAVYEMPFGADGAQLYGGRQPSGYLAADDSVWFPTSRGAAHLAHVSDVTRSPNVSSPMPYLDSVADDGRAVEPASLLSVPAGVTRLSFAFSAISLTSQAGVRFRYRLEGFDPGWNNAGTNRSATYTNLKAGTYRFQIQAFDIANPSSVREFDLALAKKPFFYETLWFYSACALLVLGFVWAVWQLRLQRIRSRFAAVLSERGRLAREMHDTVIQGCTGVSALLEAIASTPASNGRAREELLDYARSQARTTINEARQAVWDMRHERENYVEIVEALQAVATQTSREFGTQVDFRYNVERIEAAASIAHEVLMTVREAVYNSVQHSGTREVTVHLQGEGGDLDVMVRDRGCGFDASEDLVPEGHYGLLGMRERIHRVGGRISIDSKPGAGTSVHLRVHLNRRTVPDWSQVHG